MQFQEAKDFILQKLSKELPPKLSYHSVEHITDVYDACRYLAKEEGIEGQDLLMLLTAALYHDAGFLVQSNGHEKISCDFARLYLPGFEYSIDQIDAICGMIMATRIPQCPKNKLEEILCDADLDYLGRDDFYFTGKKLYKEFFLSGIVSNEEEWNKVQLDFLENHHYFTHTAIKLRKQQKDDYLREIRTKVRSCA